MFVASQDLENQHFVSKKSKKKKGLLKLGPIVRYSDLSMSRDGITCHGVEKEVKTLLFYFS